VSTETDRAALARRAIALVDLTDLADDASAASVETLCARAAEHGTAAVCVWPDFVTQAAAVLSITPVRIATVVDFPTGDERPHAVGVITERALADGAHEIDVVLPHRAWLAGDHARAAAVLTAVRAAADDRALVKVILETGELPADRVEDAARFAVEHGADFVKTSTGKTPVSATPEAVAAMLRVIAASDRPVGLKPSGGIRSVDDAAVYLALADEAMGPSWATPSTFRFGASGLLDALLAELAGEHGARSDAAY
jgi:deoxyribose-phosphate aldolase